MSSTAIAGAVLFVTALGAAWGLLGGIAARNRVGRAAVLALFGIAVFVTVLKIQRSSTVYFVPIGRFDSIPLHELEHYYQDRFGISIGSLPTLSVERVMYDPLRDQLIAEELISRMRRGYPDEARNPSVILIGLTDGDMYTRSKDWQFSFSYREEGRFGVVSAARMDPARFQVAPDEELLRSRVRKMVTRCIGVLYFKLVLSDDPRSVLYGNVLGLEELDAMGEEF